VFALGGTEYFVAFHLSEHAISSTETEFEQVWFNAHCEKVSIVVINLNL